MPRWLQEKVLIRYWEDRCSRYALPSGRQIKSARANPILDGYPDITQNYLSDDMVVPAEIEWTTTDFERHGHDIKTLLDNDGFLIVFREDASALVEQVEIDRDDFLNWFQKSARDLAVETIKEVERQAQRSKEPQIFLYYVPRTGRGRANLAIAMHHGVWGFPEGEKGRTRGWASISQVRQGDIVVVVHNFTALPGVGATGGRLSSEQYRGEFELLAGLVVTSDLYRDELTKIWTDQQYPNRFRFRRPPLFLGQRIPCNKRALGSALHETLRRLQVNGAVQRIDGSSMTKLMSLCTRHPAGDLTSPQLMLVDGGSGEDRSPMGGPERRRRATGTAPS